MPEKPMTERFVQDTVAARLNKQYYKRAPAYVATEAYTKLKRADVFLAFMRARKRPYVVVVEAKSRTTIHQLKLKDDPGKLRWTGRILTLIPLALLSGTLGYQWYFNAVNTLLLITLFLLGSAIITAVIKWLELSRLKSISVIDQLGRYPANEQWIAIGEDTFVKPEEYRALLRQCKKSRIGLIVVTRSGRLRLKAEPAPKHTFNNYLDRYGKEKDILKAIDKSSDYGPTPPERKKQRRQLFNIFLMLGFVGVLSLTVYDENVAPIVSDPFMEGAFDGLPESPVEDELVTIGRTPLDCASFTVEQRSFIVVDGLLNRGRAAERVGELVAKGFINLSTVPTECLNSWPETGNLAVWTGTFYPDRPSAKAAAEVLRQKIETAGLSAKEVRIVKVRPG
ncbi:hypothetical protein [Neolewinella antarctica]|uniref:SPOR domain-containing protein n=1 Tax=Neolewinella antarctica TaxID=442734 RepID=A0ABX0XEU2_9BACT|nr:hypothetical protein [Neolewinella antarctica]NJC27303.1 hypothetical protein [Neolewinella antarctica]